jgi:DNA-binding response OmpR family regulator
MGRILLVDDDADVAEDNASALEASGHTVTTVRTTSEARAAMRHETPDLVVLEAMLDGSTAGFDLARSIAQSNPALPLIMLSRVDEDVTAGQHDNRDGWMPVNRFMEKPVAPDVLAYEVNHLVKVLH